LHQANVLVSTATQRCPPTTLLAGTARRTNASAPSAQHLYVTLPRASR